MLLETTFVFWCQLSSVFSSLFRMTSTSCWNQEIYSPLSPPLPPHEPLTREDLRAPSSTDSSGWSARRCWTQSGEELSHVRSACSVAVYFCISVMMFRLLNRNSLELALSRPITVLDNERFTVQSVITKLVCPIVLVSSLNKTTSGVSCALSASLTSLWPLSSGGVPARKHCPLFLWRSQPHTCLLQFLSASGMS